MKKIFTFIGTLAFAGALSAQDVAPAGVQTLSSPDGNLSLKFTLTEKGEPCYWLDYKDKAAVMPSTMGFELRGKMESMIFNGLEKKAEPGAPVSLMTDLSWRRRSGTRWTRHGHLYGEKSP